MAGIQNIDFSQKLSTPAAKERPAAQQKSPFELSRLLGWGLAGAILIFTVGILAGLKIAELRSFEKNLVKYPDSKPANFANASTSAESQSEQVQREYRTSDTPAASRNDRATLIIRIGAFSPGRAGELARSLNQLPELEGIPYLTCKGVEDLNPDRSHVFAVPVEGAKSHRLFAGCYASKEQARKALEALQNTGVASLKDSKLYELDE